MLTIDRLAKIDNIAANIIAALYRGVDWVGARCEARLVDAVYRVTEAKAAAIGKAEGKINDLEDEQSEATASYIEAKAKLRADFERRVESLDEAQAKTEADIQAKLARAALALIAANKDYDATARAANEKLGVEVGA